MLFAYMCVYVCFYVRVCVWATAVASRADTVRVVCFVRPRSCAHRYHNATPRFFMKWPTCPHKRSFNSDPRRFSRTVVWLSRYFGDLVTMQWWDGLWLNESFATFMAAVAVSKATRFGDVSWVNYCTRMKFWGYGEDQLPTTHAIQSAVADALGTHRPAC